MSTINPPRLALPGDLAQRVADCWPVTPDSGLGRALTNWRRHRGTHRGVARTQGDADCAKCVRTAEKVAAELAVIEAGPGAGAPHSTGTTTN